MNTLPALVALTALGGEPQFVPGELIVAFKKDTEAGAITAALSKGDSAGRGRLDAYVDGLSAKLAIPIKTKRVGSGGDVLLAIDLPELRARLISQLKGDPRVVRATPAEAGGEVRLQLAAGASLPEVTRRLAKDLGFALASRTTPKNELFVDVDDRALTLHLVERLRQLPEVEYAQPNFVVRKLGP